MLTGHRRPKAASIFFSHLSAWPMFRRALLELLDELPSATTGLGSSEMRLLALMARRYSSASSLFTRAGLGRPPIFQEFELGSLLEGLAQGSEPPYPALTISCLACAENTRRTALMLTIAVDHC
jgi:hypothetical protein